MPSLKDLRNRIGSVKSTRKITSAMKMVAAAKLRRAQEQAEAGQPYAERMAGILSRLAANITPGPTTSKLLAGTGQDRTHLIVVITSDRGLAGGFNANAVREARRFARKLESEGKAVRIVTLGRKGRESLRRDYLSHMVEAHDPGTGKPVFGDAEATAQAVLALFDKGGFDVAHIVYNRFKSVMTQIPTVMQIIPFAIPKTEPVNENRISESGAQAPKPVYEFEPDEETILAALLPRNLAVQLYRALLDSAAGEQAARMTAMDNATRNAGDMIAKLTLNYNRARQASITKELIEIISGAEAV
jgi:F-type H+-transporting ATPase subunit gamma